MKQIYFYFASFNDELYRSGSDAICLLVPIAGESEWTTANAVYSVNHTHLCLLTGHNGRFRACSDMNENLIIQLPQDYIQAYIKTDTTIQEGIVWKLDAELQPIKEMMIREVDAHNEEEAILLMNYLLHKVARQTVTTSLLYIQKHFTEKIDIRALAEMEHYTPSYYCDWFKRKMKMTPLEYIHFLRIHRAKELLQDSRLSVLSIACQLGYEYNASFTRMFKKYERISPSEYRSAQHAK